jgi:hypothetical protein
LKDDAGEWIVAGHRDRVIVVDNEVLKLFAELYDEPGTQATQARLPALHARQLAPVLARLRDMRRLSSVEDWGVSDLLNETRSVKEGTIRRETCFPESPEGLVLTGPHFFVANPLYK